MATVYYLPQPLIFQEFLQTVAPPSRRLFACLIGPNAQLLRYDNEDEKPDSFVGQYDNVGAFVDGDYKTCYAWPHRAAGAVVDPTSTRVFVDNALLRMFYDNGGTMRRTGINRIRHPSVNFATNGAYARNGALKRDIRVGDYVRVSATVTSVTYDLFTYVRGIIGDPIASVVAAATAASGNAGTQAFSDDIVDGDDNSGNVSAAVDGSDYDGTADGDLTETYTITVTQASTGSVATTARLRVVSASGRDDALSVTPAAFSSPTAIGSRGLKVTFTTSGSNFTLGDVWTVTVAQAWDTSVATSGGTYTGTADRTYLIEVTKGGLWDDEPEITVQASDGSDVSGPTVVPYSAPGMGTTFGPGDPDTGVAAVGTAGVTIRFSDEGLRKGDRFVIVATAAKEGPMRTLVLAHSLDTAVTLNAAVSMELALYIRKDIEVAAKHVLTSGAYAWEQSDTEICLFADLYATDAEWVDGNGALVPLPVITDDVTGDSTNKLYVQYRAWLPATTTGVSSLTDVGDIDQVPGPLVEENLLKWGLYKALLNNNGQPVKYIGVADPTSLQSWTQALGRLEERKDVYGLVPLTYNQDVLDAVEGHVNAQSDVLAARWRTAWFGLQGVTSQDIATQALSTNNTALLGTTEDDTGTTGTQYTILRLTSGNFSFISDGVAAGDTVRYVYTSNAWGEPIYSEFLVDEVLSEDSLRLFTGTVAAESTPRKFEIHRTLSTTQQAEAIGHTARAWDNRRVKAVWLDNVVGGQPTTPTYFVAAALAAEAGGVAPQQGLTNSSLNGFDGLGGRVGYFTRTELDSMAALGTWIVVESEDGVMKTRHALTTSTPTVETLAEEVYSRNLDSISYYLYDLFEPYHGVANITEELLEVLRAELAAAGQYLKENGKTRLLGGQIESLTFIEPPRRHLIFKTHVTMYISLDLPDPLNNAEIHLLV